jgi:hypothetical protein
MKNIKFYILILLISIIKCEQNQFSNTTNSCFYATGKAIGGDLITQIFISGSSVPEQLATCCYMCRALPGKAFLYLLII